MNELKAYSLPDLEDLAKRIETEISRREQEEHDTRLRAEQAARDAADEAARQAEQVRLQAEAKVIELEQARQAEAQASIAQAQADARKAAESQTRTVRYMHPSNRSLVWDGSGPRPDWVSAWLFTGGTLYALEVAAEKLAPRPIPASLRPQ